MLDFPFLGSLENESNKDQHFVIMHKFFKNILLFLQRSPVFEVIVRVCDQHGPVMEVGGDDEWLRAPVHQGQGLRLSACVGRVAQVSSELLPLLGSGINILSSTKIKVAPMPLSVSDNISPPASGPGKSVLMSTPLSLAAPEPRPVPEHSPSEARSQPSGLRAGSSEMSVESTRRVIRAS